MSEPPSAPANIGLVGPGRVGRVIARALAAAGIVVHGPVGRGEPIPDVPVVLLCVPDDAITAAADAARAPGRLIGHTSGATPLDAVDFGVHPLQTITGGEGADAFAGGGCAVAGRTPEALAVATALATAVGARPFAVDDAQRALYHAAASVASNYTIAVLDAAERLAQAAGLSDARAAFAPLVVRTVENWVARGSAALTGPVARGDEGTVARQRAAIVASAPGVLDLFDALTVATRKIAPAASTAPEAAPAAASAAAPGTAPAAAPAAAPGTAHTPAPETAPEPAPETAPVSAPSPAPDSGRIR